MDQKIIDLYDEYTHELLDRREFLRKLSILAGEHCCCQRSAAFTGK